LKLSAHHSAGACREAPGIEKAAPVFGRCSTGQEAYSLAMLLLEMGLTGWDLRISATDLNRKVPERAAEGQFLQLEVSRGLPERYVQKYFRRSGAAWRISDHVRKMISFEQFALRGSPARLAAFDAVLCRKC